MKRRYVYDRAHDKMVEVTDNHSPPLVDKPSHHVMKDIAPYQSMVTGEMINSRSRHREHLREHGLIEVGNEVEYMKKNIRRPEPPPGLHETMMRAAIKHGILKP